MFQRFARPSARNAYLFLTLTMLFWSGNFIAGRAAAGHIPPITLAFLRWGGATLILLPFAWASLKSDWPQVRTNLGILLLLGVTGSGLYNTLQFIALTTTTATAAAVVNSSAPVLIAVACYMIFGDQVTRRQAIGIAVSLIGVLVIVARGSITALQSLAFEAGAMIMLAATATWAAYTAILRMRPPIKPLTFAVVTYGIAALVNLPLAGLELAAGATVNITPVSICAVVYTATLPSLVAYILYNRGVEIIGATRAGVFIHLTPLFTAILAIAFLGEHPALFHVAGFLLILTGIWLASLA